MYRVKFTARARKEIQKLDKKTSLLLLGWIRKHLEGCENPRFYGKLLQGNLKNAWRYRVGGYRILAEIKDQEILILVLSVGHRKDIYEKM